MSPLAKDGIALLHRLPITELYPEMHHLENCLCKSLLTIHREIASLINDSDNGAEGNYLYYKSEEQSESSH